MCRRRRQGVVAVLDCGRVTALRLRLPDTQRDVLVLEPGVHAVSPALLGSPGSSGTPFAHIYVDSRGVWLQLQDGVRGAYVNGRPIRHMAMLRAGDSLFVHGMELAIVGREPVQASSAGSRRAPSVQRCVLRATTGPLHGRCIALERPCVIGRAPDSEARIDDANVAPRHVELAPQEGGVMAAVEQGAGAVRVNGHPFTAGMLRPGDQLVVAGQHRFVLEAPRATWRADEEQATPVPARSRNAPAAKRRRRWRIPWLLVAAVLLAAALSLLLLYGAG